MIAFIDLHRGEYGVEPICRVVPIAPSTYYAHKACHTDPTCLSARVQRDAELQDAIERVREFACSWTAGIWVYLHSQAQGEIDRLVLDEPLVADLHAQRIEGDRE